MSKHRLYRIGLLFVLLVFVLGLSSCDFLLPDAISDRQQSQNLGDYGDAPDGSRGMDTGYYAPTGGPWVFTYQSAGVPAKFPTVGDAPVSGPFTIN